MEVCVKPVDAAEMEVLTRWIAAGAPEATVSPNVASRTPDPLVSDKDREFWAFRPPRASPIPAVKNRARVVNPIDNFILHQLEAKGLTLAPKPTAPH